MSAAALAPIRATRDRSDTIALADPACAYCAGLGAVRPWARLIRPCYCVCRAIFCACLSRYRYIHAGIQNGMVCRWKDLDYCADFEMVARRELDARDYQIFRLHFVDGLDWVHCAPRFNMSRGNVFHAIYRIEERLGRCFLELRPYGLWPLDLYFHSHAKIPNQSLCWKGHL
jgi:hypothetical protein